MVRQAHWTLVATLLFLCGCAPSAEEPEPNTHLPGFDVWMPTGIVVRKTSNPAIGNYQVRSGTAVPALPQPLRALFPERAPSTKVSWRVETTAFSEPADVAALLDSVMRGLATGGKGRAVAAGDGRWTSTYEFGKGKLVVGYARCEPWLTIIFMIGLEGDVHDERVALKIVKSVRCRIGKEPAPTLQLSLRVPAHFGLAHNTDEPTYFSTAGGALVTSFTDGNVARDKRLLKQVLGSIFATVLESRSPLDVSTAQIKRPDAALSTLNTLSARPRTGEVAEFEIATLYCADLDSTVMLLIFGDGDPRTSSADLAESLECPKPDAAQTSHASIDAIFSPVCESGDLLACQRLIEFIRTGNAAGSVMSLERARARACALGDRDQCA